MLTDAERCHLQAPVIRSEFDGVAQRFFVMTPWYSPVLVHSSLIEEAWDGSAFLQLDEPDKLRIKVENGEATYQLLEYDQPNDWWEARLVESWMEPHVYAEWLTERETQR